METPWEEVHALGTKEEGREDGQMEEGKEEEVGDIEEEEHKRLSNSEARMERRRASILESVEKFRTPRILPLFSPPPSPMSFPDAPASPANATSGAAVAASHIFTKEGIA